MAQNSWPFVGGGGTAVGEDQWSIMARAFCADGVIAGYANTLEVYGDSSGRQVKVKTGRATVRGHWYENTAVVTLAIGANSSGDPRIDRVVLRLDPSENSIVLAVVEGTPAGSPSAPTLTQTDVGTYEMTLAQVAVANGASTITAGNVTDERIFQPGAYVTATRSTPQAISTGGAGYRVTFESESGPLAAALDASEGTFTVPAAGLWAVTFWLTWDLSFSDIPGAVSNHATIRNATTGVLHARLAASLEYVSLAAVLHAEAGDVLDFYVYQAYGGTRNVNNAVLTVARIA